MFFVFLSEKYVFAGGFIDEYFFRVDFAAYGMFFNSTVNINFLNPYRGCGTLHAF